MPHDEAQPVPEQTPEPRKTFYPVDDFDRSALKNPATAVLNYSWTDVTDATTHATKSKRGGG